MAPGFSCHCRFVTVLIVASGLLPLMIARTSMAQDDEMASLNFVHKEDHKDVERLTNVAQLIKPYCPSMLPNELQFPAVPVNVGFNPGQKSLWVQAVSQPEADLQLEAAQAIARAHAEGIPNFEDTAPVLAELLGLEATDQVVRLAAAQSLIVLNHRESAPLLSRHAADGLDFALLIEPALADWNDSSMRTVWLSRLESRTASPGLIKLAIQAAAKTELVEATPYLRKLVFDRFSAPHLRLEAAKALGTFADENAIADSRRLLSSVNSGGAFLEHLLAASLLVQQVGPDAEALLLELAVDPQPVTAAIAIRRLIELDPQLTEPVIDHALKSSDPILRTLGCEALFRSQIPADVVRLSELLSDEHTQVRSNAQELLIESDQVAGVSDSVRESAMRVLNSDQPRGMAQAAIVLGTVDHKPAAERLIELLGSEEGDVSITAAWALRRLAVPETAGPVFKHLSEETEDSLIERLYPSEGGDSLEWIWDMYEQHKHLIELLGLLEYQPADPLFRQFVPPPENPPVGHPYAWIHCTFRRELRSRAMWALGKIHTEPPQDDLVPLLVERFEDMDEVSHVAAMIALSLGRMKATDVESSLREFYKAGVRYTESAPPESVRAFASRVALEEITGESLPELIVEPYEIYRSSWFLEPLDIPGAAAETN